VRGLRLTPAAQGHQKRKHVRRLPRDVELPSAPAEGRVSPPRSFRLGERVRHRPRQQGRIVIRALVRGRLLGLKILTLDACVVIGGDDGLAAVVPVPLSAAGLDVSHRSAVPRLTSPAAGSGTSLAYAMQLLEQGVHTLEQSRRLRLGDLDLSASSPPSRQARRHRRTDPGVTRRSQRDHTSTVPGGEPAWRLSPTGVLSAGLLPA
jgi:hypothetical protein